MLRRDLLKGAAAGITTLAAPRIGRAERTSKLVFVPTEDLGALDPVISGIRSTRNHGYLVFDTLYGIDTSWMAQPQMVKGGKAHSSTQFPELGLLLAQRRAMGLGLANVPAAGN